MPATALDHAVAGTGGNVLSYLLFYPIDMVRMHQQISTVVCDEEEEKETYEESAIEVFRRLAREGTLYAGVGPSAISVGASSAIYFYVLKTIGRAIKGGGGGDRSPLSNAQQLAVAFLAGAINAMLTCPLWVATQRLKSAPRSSESFVGTLKRLYEDGDMFQGLLPSIVLCVNPSIQFAAYEALRRRMLTKGNVSIHPGWGFLFGALAKAVATVLTYPLQIVQTRSRQRVGGRASLLATFRDVRRTEGWRGFSKGLYPKLVQTVSNSAFIFMFYEALLRRTVVMRRCLRA